MLQIDGLENGVALKSNSLLSASMPRESRAGVGLDAVLDVDAVLDRAGEAELVIEPVVGAGSGDHVVVIGRAAEPLEAVVGAVDRLP